MLNSKKDAFPSTNPKSLLLTVFFCLGTWQIGHAEKKYKNDGIKETHITEVKSDLTAEDQIYGSPSDIKLTRTIREKIFQDPSLSVYAQNITVVTMDKTVTLKGRVKNTMEAQKIKSMVSKLVDTEIRSELTFIR